MSISIINISQVDSDNDFDAELSLTGIDGRQADWSVAIYRYQDAPGETVPVIFKKALGNTYAGDGPIQLLGTGRFMNGENNYIKAVLLDATDNVVVASSIQGPYTGFPETTLTLVSSADGALDFSVDFSLFGPATTPNLSESVYGYTAVVRVYTDAAGTIPLTDNGNDKIGYTPCVGGETSTVVTVSGLTVYGDYYFRSFISTGSSETGESTVFGPYTLAPPSPPTTTIERVFVGNNRLLARISLDKPAPIGAYVSVVAYEDAMFTTLATTGGVSPVPIAASYIIAGNETTVHVDINNAINGTPYYLRSFAYIDNAEVGVGTTSESYTPTSTPVTEIASVIPGDGKITVVVDTAMLGPADSESWYVAVYTYDSIASAENNTPILINNVPIVGGNYLSTGGYQAMAEIETGLVSGQTYYLRSFVNIGGSGDVYGSVVSQPVVYYAPNSEIMSVAALNSELSVTVSRRGFTNRTDTQSARVFVFTDANATMPAVFNEIAIMSTAGFNSGAETTIVTVTGLAKGATYYLRSYIYDNTSLSDFGPSQITPFIPVTTITNVTAGNGQLTVNMEFPEIGLSEQGWVAVLRFYTDSSGTDSLLVNENPLIATTQLAPGDTTATIIATGLTNDTTYYFRTFIFNGVAEVGRSANGSGAPIGPVTTITNVVVGNGQLTVNMEFPEIGIAEQGWIAVLRFYTDSSGTDPLLVNENPLIATTQLASGDTSATITATGLTNDTTYYFRTFIFNGVTEVGRSANGSGTPIQQAFFEEFTPAAILSKTQTDIEAIPASDFAGASAAQLEALAAADLIRFLNEEQVAAITTNVASNATATALKQLIQRAYAIDVANNLGRRVSTEGVLLKANVSKLAELTEANKLELRDIVGSTLIKYVETKTTENGGTKADADKLLAAVGAVATTGNAPLAQVADLNVLVTPVQNASLPSGGTVLIPAGSNSLTALPAKSLYIGGSNGDSSTFTLNAVVQRVTFEANSFTLEQLGTGGAVVATRSVPLTTETALAIGGKIMTNVGNGSTLLATALAPSIQSASSSNGTSTFTIALNNTASYAGFNLEILFYQNGNYLSSNNTTITELTTGVTLTRAVSIADGTYTIKARVTNTIGDVTHVTPSNGDYPFTVLSTPSGGGGGGSGAICFLADAPVLTPAGYRPIHTLQVGDKVRTAAGRTVTVKRVFAKEYQAGPAVNPFVIPKGSFGALRALPISPNHEVMTAKGMVKAKDLGLPRMKMTGSFTYYNLELEDWVRDNLVVAGVECESLAPAKRITMTKAEFGRFVAARYGPGAAARLRTVCFEEKDGSVSMPAFV